LVICFIIGDIKMDYAVAGKRKSKGDKKAKSRYNRYKKGGGRRTGGRTEDDADKKIRERVNRE
jgi:hypothetical protein